MVLLVFLLFAFFGFAALVVDLGLGRTTQAQIWGATDAAALEGVRWRDEFPDSVSDASAYVADHAGGNPADLDSVARGRDLARREAAAAVVAQRFGAAGSADPVEAQRQQQFGAGPVFQREPSAAFGDNPFNAGETIRVPPTTSPFLKLVPATNADQNQPYGDMVAGTYDAAADHTYGPADADGHRGRLDLAASTAGAAPLATAFLVRLRRTPEAAEDAVATAGPVLPFLFGRGTTIAGTPNPTASAYSARRDGLGVRATSIANAVPAVYVGAQFANGNRIAGAVRIAVWREFWESGLPPAPQAGAVGMPQDVTINGDQIEATSAPGVAVGLLLAADAASIGAPLTPGAYPVATEATGYFPIVQQIESTAGDATGPYRVIGFGLATLRVAGDGSVTLAKLAPAGGAVAARNASADLRLAWPTVGPPALNEFEQAQVRSANAGLKDPLLAPALVRDLGAGE